MIDEHNGLMVDEHNGLMVGFDDLTGISQS